MEWIIARSCEIKTQCTERKILFKNLISSFKLGAALRELFKLSDKDTYSH